MVAKQTDESLKKRVAELERQVNELESEAIKYRTLFHSFPHGITISDAQGGIIETNPAAEQLLEIGKQAHENRAIDSPEWRIVRPDGSDMPPEEWASVIALKEKRTVSNSEMGVIKEGGEVTWISVTAAPLPMDDYGVVVTYKDVSERKRSESILDKALEEAHLRQKEISTLLKASQAIPVSKTFNEAARSIFEACKNVIGARSGYVALLSEDGEENEVLFLDAGDLPCDVNPELPMPIRGLRELAYKTQDVAYDNDFMRSPWMKYMPIGHVALDNVLFAPVNIENRTVGVIGLANKTGGFTERDGQIAASFGDLAAVALTYAEYQDELRESKKRLQVIFDNAPVAMLLLNENTEVLKMNQTGLVAAGKTNESVMGLQAGDILDCIGSFQHPDGCGFGEDCKNCVIRRTVAETFATNQTAFKVEAKLSRKQNDKISEHTVWISTAIVSSKAPKTVLVAMDDITERKQAEEALKESEARLQAFFDHSPAGLLIWEAGDPVRYLAINQTLAKINGRPVDEHIGKTLAEVFDDPKIVRENNRLCRTILENKTPLVFESSGVPQTGQPVNYLAQYFPIFKDDSEPLGIGAMVFDITEQKRTERELRDSERRFRELFNNMGAGVAIYDSPDEGQSFVFKDLNRSGLDSANKKKTEVFGREVREVFPGIGALGLLDVFKRVWETGAPERHASTKYRDTKLELYVENYVCKRPSGELVAIYEDTTARVQAELALQESEGFLDTIVENIPDMIFVKDAKELRFVRFNKAGEDLLGYSRDDMIGKNDHDFFPKEEADFFTGKDREVFRRGTLLDISEEPIQTRHKGVRILHTKKMPLLGPKGEPRYLLGISQDITRQKRVEEALRQSEEKYRSMMEAMNDGAYICSADFHIDYVNPAMIRQIGYDATGEICHKAIHGRQDHCPWCPMAKIKQGQNVEAEIVSPGNDHIYHVSHSPMDLPDGSISKMTIYRDITQLRKMEKQLQQSQKLESIGTLAGGIAHDFNNILFPISGYTGFLMEDVPADSPLQECLQGIQAGVKRAGDLVKQILAFSRHSDQELKPVRVPLIIKEVLKLVRSTLPATIEIIHDVSDGCPLVLADATQIHQVAMNLITNAFHAMEDKGGILSVSLKAVVLTDDDLKGSPMAPGSFVNLTVADTGAGMEEGLLERIFDPYFTTKKEGKGTGLGLSVVHGIVREHDGDIRVVSSPGEGTVFDVFLPAIATETEVAQDKKITIVPQGSERVLLVDDEEAIVKMLDRMLTRLGYQVRTRTSSVDALALFREDPGAFDLVITDMTMPNLTGDKLAQQMLALRPGLPIIICTGFSEKISIEKAEALGVRGLLMKPVVKDKMANLLRKVLDTPR